MKPSVPVHRLKREARLLARREKIPLHEALDRLAATQGRKSWSHLMQGRLTPVRALFERLDPGDLLLIGARPGQGKTLLGLRLVMEALAAGRRGVFFTLEYAERDVRARLRALGFDAEKADDRLSIDTSDAIRATYIVDILRDAPRGTLAVVDYLQLLDRSRDTPPLAEQVQMLRTFARDSGMILVFLSQIDRAYDPDHMAVPDIGHVRLANPLDLSLFSKTCFLNGGEMRFGAV